MMDDRKTILSHFANLVMFEWNIWPTIIYHLSSPSSLPFPLRIVSLIAVPNFILPIRGLHTKFLLFVLFFALGKAASAQYRVQGTVYDSSRLYPMEAVSVLSTGGAGTFTDANGHYSITVNESDSIWFSYLGKPTMKFPVIKITDLSQFNLSLQVKVTVMQDLKIRPRNYRQDSAQNREDYAKAFNFQKPNLGTMTSIGPTGAGIDINELIRTFQFRKNKSMERFRDRLVAQEQEKYVDYRFSKALVRRLTGLADTELEQFMTTYRPTYEFAVYSNDYDFQLYIKEAHKMYQRQKAF
jgi:hypothetical protein